MNRKMRFGENDRSGDSLRFKPMKRALQNGRASGLGGCNHHSRDAVDIRKQGGATARKLAHDVPAECLQFVQVSLTLEESHLRTSSAGGCDADTSPTYRRAPAGAFERCAGDSPRWRVGARPPKPWPPLDFAQGTGPLVPSKLLFIEGPAPIIPPHPPAVKSSLKARPAMIVKLTTLLS